MRILHHSSLLLRDASTLSARYSSHSVYSVHSIEAAAPFTLKGRQLRTILDLFCLAELQLDIIRIICILYLTDSVVVKINVVHPIFA
jgi:hypothetical protein